MIRHDHLRTAVEDYSFSRDREILLRVINELRYSNLFIASRRKEGKLIFDIHEQDGERLTPLFTDLDEVAKFYRPGEVEVFSNSFELYRNVLKTSDIDGYILNPSCENHIFKKEFIMAITDIPKTSYVTSNPYSPNELKLMADCENPELEEFIEKGISAADYEALFEMLSESSVFVLMLSENNLEPLFENGVLDMRETGPVASMHVDDVAGRYAAIFSSKRKMGHVTTSRFRYAQIVNLSMLVNFVLTEDMDGIILNHSSDDILISRNTLMMYSLGFERYADDERLSESMYYIFEI